MLCGGRQVSFGCSREGILLNCAAAHWPTLAQGGTGDLLPGRADQFLRLGSPSSSVGLHCLETLLCMLTCEFFDLGSLFTDNSGSLVDLLVNELLVLDVYQRPEENDAGAEKGQTPKWKDLNKVVGDERRCECLRCSSQSRSPRE
jgi:hypothetical protein